MELSVQLNSTIFEERSTIASCLCLCLGATRAACVARPACFGPVPLSLPLEVLLRVLQGLIASHLSYHTRFYFFCHACTRVLCHTPALVPNGTQTCVFERQLPSAYAFALVLHCPRVLGVLCVVIFRL